MNIIKDLCMVIFFQAACFFSLVNTLRDVGYKKDMELCLRRSALSQTLHDSGQWLSKRYLVLSAKWSSLLEKNICYAR